MDQIRIGNSLSQVQVMVPLGRGSVCILTPIVTIKKISN